MKKNLYSKQVLQKTSFTVFPYTRINYNNLSNYVKIVSLNKDFKKVLRNYKFIWPQYNSNLISYSVSPTNLGTPDAKILPPVFPFKGTKYEISNGIPNLGKSVKRNKLPIVSYNSATRTYTLSNTFIDYSNFYKSLVTRVYYKDLFKVVVIQNINQNNKTFTTTTEEWGKNLTSQTPLEFYVLDEQIEVSDETAGTWKLFPYFNTSLTTDIGYINELGHNIAFNGNAVPQRDTKFNQTYTYSRPFSLYVKTLRYVNRYYLPTDQDWKRRNSQSSARGRYIYSQQPAFIEFAELAVAPLSSRIHQNQIFTTSPENNNYVDSDIFNNIQHNYRSVASQIVETTPSTYVPYIQLDSFYQELDSQPSYYSTSRVSLLSTTNIGVTQISPTPITNVDSEWGKYFGMSDDILAVGAPGINQIHLYKLNYSDSLPYNLNIIPFTIITQPLQVFKNIYNVSSLSGYGTNLVLDSKFKRSKSLDYMATTFKATINNKVENVIEVSSILNGINGSTSFKRDFHVLDSLVPHLSSNSSDTNNISKLAIMVDSGVNNDKVFVIAAHRPNVVYQGKTGVIDLYGCSDSTSVKLLSVLNANNSALGSIPGVKFGTNFSGEQSTLCVGVSCNTSSQVEVFDFKASVQALTVSDSSSLGGVSSNYKLNFSLNKTDVVRSTDSLSDTNFGKIIYFDQAENYDPFYESQPLYTNRLFIGNGQKTYIYEEFNNKFLPSEVIINNSKGIAAYFNNFASISSNSSFNKSIIFSSIIMFQEGNSPSFITPSEGEPLPPIEQPQKNTKYYSVYVAGDKGRI